MPTSIQHAIIINDTASVIGGAAKVAICSAICLAEKGVHVVFFAASGPVDPRLASSSLIDVICLNQPLALDDPSRARGAARGLWNSTAYRKLLDILKGYSKQDTIVHLHSWTKSLSASVFKATADGGFPLFLTIHDYFLVCPNGGFYNYVDKSICRETPMTLKCIVCNCDRRSYLQKLYRCLRMYLQQRAIAKVELRPCFLSDFSRGVIFPLLNPKPDHFSSMWNPIETIDSLSEPQMHEELVALYVGRLDKEKGIDLFCDAVSKSKFKGVVIGDGDAAKDLAELYPMIEFHGWQDPPHISNEMKRAAVLVFPSRWFEVSPLTTREAVETAYLPVIASDGCAAAEQIEPGITGLLFETGNSASLYSALESLDYSKIKRMKQNVFYSVKEHGRRTMDRFGDELIVSYESWGQEEHNGE